MTPTKQIPLDMSMKSTVRLRIEEALHRHAGDVLELSHALHADPELSGEEFRAAERVRELLRVSGFSLDRRQPEAPTAFCASAGTGNVVVVLCVEYDALPGIGHACGHNVNGAASVGAALALAAVAEELGITVRVLGTPAEEAHGGKVDLIREGFLAGASLALMAHASASDSVGSSSLALCAWEVSYEGSAAHAAIAPEEGVNALDGLVVAQTAIGLARQQLSRDAVVSLVILEGGSAVNIIPAHVRAHVEMRAATSAALATVQDRVRRCLEAGAMASGAGLTMTPLGNDFAELRQDAYLADAYRDAMKHRGRDVVMASAPVASTDMGNVSHVVPSIHPTLGYDVQGAIPHTAEFASHGASPSADRAVLDGSYGLAMCAAITALDPEQRRRLSQPQATQTN
ncbi:M20 family metallopeptidase [Paenarthrobacter sp. PH39-S1]|uniref:M20 family metallopeptidase n=1 Tax=Paenarthrobacter sp. PH39-S1 TaxID=3046204 RepID=UPI0024BB009E|nr:M20 family metallopeptidase [Paenarthrobacter sp. PH39-S1]MDJ0358249.1 M20 family metallopeptidase [Paenarthrobacter sp. PH39-S1]